MRVIYYIQCYLLYIELSILGVKCCRLFGGLLQKVADHS